MYIHICVYSTIITHLILLIVISRVQIIILSNSNSNNTNRGCVCVCAFPSALDRLMTHKGHASYQTISAQAELQGGFIPGSIPVPYPLSFFSLPQPPLPLCSQPAARTHDVKVSYPVSFLVSYPVSYRTAESCGLIPLNKSSASELTFCRR